MFKHMPRYEKIWLTLGAASLVVFLAILGFMAVGLGLDAPGHMDTIVPAQAMQTPPFDAPGLKQIGEKEYELVMLGQVFAFAPGEVNIPEGSTVHFRITTPDVVHGLLIPGTNVNMMIVPGHITEFTYTFRKAGDYLMLCNEYCGVGHHLMMGKLIVQA
ncbi:cytochrome c oxidase subunit II [Paenibacillus xanthanilyticus]|uniref:Cytochrome aa3 subunit 2 n=1 Tax=Paenibacillus xanthanilyticus TaxID=1783531 RepID=A0ABV8K7R8_9BACL